MKHFFLGKRKRTFLNPIQSYSYHRRKIAEEFPTSLPPDEEETLLTTTLLLQAIKKQGYTTTPICIEKRDKAG